MTFFIIGHGMSVKKCSLLEVRYQKEKRKLLRVSAVSSVCGVAFEGHKAGTVMALES